MQPNWIYKIIEIPVTVTLNAYDASDVVGGVLTSDPIGQIRGGGYIEMVRLADADDQKEPYLLYLFSATPPSATADAAAFAPTNADWIVCLGCISIPAANYDATGADACAFVDALDVKTNKNIAFPNLQTDRLYGYLVANASTPDYAAATDLTLHIGMWVA